MQEQPTPSMATKKTTTLESLLNRTLPSGAPVPDEDFVDNSFCSDWRSPPPPPPPPHLPRPKLDSSAAGIDSIRGSLPRTTTMALQGKGNEVATAGGGCGEEIRVDRPPRWRIEDSVRERRSSPLSDVYNSLRFGFVSPMDVVERRDFVEEFSDTDSSDLFSLRSMSIRGIGGVDLESVVDSECGRSRRFEGVGRVSSVESRRGGGGEVDVSGKCGVEVKAVRFMEEEKRMVCHGNAGSSSDTDSSDLFTLKSLLISNEGLQFGSLTDSSKEYRGDDRREECTSSSVSDTKVTHEVKRKPVKVVKFKLDNEIEMNENKGKVRAQLGNTSSVINPVDEMQEMSDGVRCMGLPICESKNAASLWKILSSMCNPVEAKRIEEMERGSSENRVRADQIFVNGKQLTEGELSELLGCSKSPKNLKPGRYWYDKDTGFWGNEGVKPHKIIMSKLNVGGRLQADASNGNTNVYINGREITKDEHRVLKLAKVPCHAGTHFWVYDDGSYEEEGQNNRQGNIWGKATTRLMCSLLSLPAPHRSSHLQEGNRTVCPIEPVSEHLEQGNVRKLLIVGLRGSGTSTMFKQARFLYGNAYTREEIQSIKLVILSNLYKYLVVLLGAREAFEEDALQEKQQTSKGDSELGEGKLCKYSINARLKKRADRLLATKAGGRVEAFIRAVARDLWKDPAIQETYKRKQEIPSLPWVAKYFLDQASVISSKFYEPSEKDILYAEGVTRISGHAFSEFLFEPKMQIRHKNVQPLQPSKYQLIQLHSSMQDGSKWHEQFNEIIGLIFCVGLSEYDETWRHGPCPPRNKMLVSRDAFESLARGPSVKGTQFFLVLNKLDIFEEKIDRVPLTVCKWFEDFDSAKLRRYSSGTLALAAYQHVAAKFKETYFAITGRKLFVCKTRVLERSSVDEAFKHILEELRQVVQIPRRHT